MVEEVVAGVNGIFLWPGGASRASAIDHVRDLASLLQAMDLARLPMFLIL